jgi:hypothetical protein
MTAKRVHYNDPDRFSPPWEDGGKHDTRTAGVRRLWLHPPGGQRPYWICAVAGEGSTSGNTRAEAIENGKNW